MALYHKTEELRALRQNVEYIEGLPDDASPGDPPSSIAVERLNEIRAGIDADVAERCLADVGRRPGWMGVDQYDPCPCLLRKDHDGPHECRHGKDEV